ncbi:MAG: histidinol-phosphate transaminase [Gammaproteobacteria bacterium]|nr:histidinol-phosphate transaminase [Gammaproteobacteria bacterium]
MSFDPGGLATPGVARLTPYLPGKPVEELQREYGISDALKLASNENPLGPSPRAMQAMQSLLQGINYYPDQHALVRCLAIRHEVATEAITLGNGSNDVLDLVARAFLLPGSNAVFSQHAFAVYWLSTMACSAEPKVVPALPATHPRMPYGHDLNGMLEAVDRHTRVIFIANPNNPTGTWLERAELQTFLNALPDHVVVVLDEAYTEYVDLEEFPDGMQWLGRYPQLIVTRTFSKIYGLAGARCGYAVCSGAIADLLNRVRHPFNVNKLAIGAALAALEDDEFVTRSAATNRAGLQRLQAAFAEMGLTTMPSVANFVCVDVGREAAPVFEALLRLGVIVRPVANYQLPGHLRVTVGRTQDNERVIDAFATVLNA